MHFCQDSLKNYFRSFLTRLKNNLKKYISVEHFTSFFDRTSFQRSLNFLLIFVWFYWIWILFDRIYRKIRATNPNFSNLFSILFLYFSLSFFFAPWKPRLESRDCFSSRRNQCGVLSWGDCRFEKKSVGFEGVCWWVGSGDDVALSGAPGAPETRCLARCVRCTCVTNLNCDVLFVVLENNFKWH